MQCQHCKNNTATIHLTELVDGKRDEIHLCELCAQKQGIAVKNQIPLSELLGTLLSAQSQPKNVSDDASKDIVCPYCGITFEQFRKQSLLGCPHDYEVFEDLLLPLIEAAHDEKTTHCGKVPAKAPADTKKQAQLRVLSRQLEGAVRDEDYETAAKLRDQIKQIEN